MSYKVKNQKVQDLLLNDPFSQYDKASKIGLSQSMIARLEAGVKKCDELRIHELIKIANYYNLPINEFFEYRGQ